MTVRVESAGNRTRATIDHFTGEAAAPRELGDGIIIQYDRDGACVAIVWTGGDGTRHTTKIEECDGHELFRALAMALVGLVAHADSGKDYDAVLLFNDAARAALEAPPKGDAH